MFDARADNMSFSLDAGAESGSFISSERIGQEKVLFGTDNGRVIEFDIRDSSKPVAVVQRPDESRITCLFGKGNYSTSLGTVVLHGAQERQIAEVGQPIVRCGKLQERSWAITTDSIVFF